MDSQVEKDILDFLEAMKFNFIRIDDYLEHGDAYMAKQVAYGSLLGATERLKEIRQDHKVLESEELKTLRQKISVSEKLRAKERDEYKKEIAKYQEKEKSLLEANKELKEDFESKEEARKARNKEKMISRLRELNEK